MSASTHPSHIVAVCGLVTNESDQVLMIEHPRRGWEFPGGQVEEGEMLTDALIRETFEETGVTIEVGQLIGIYSNVQLPAKVIMSFTCKYREGEPTTSPESQRVEWMSRDQALAVITHPSVRTRMEDMLNFCGSVVYCAYSMKPYVIHERRSIGHV